MTHSRLNLSAVVLLLLACVGLAPTAKAASATVPPSVTMYFPGERPGDPMNFNPGSTGYIYFETGAKVLNAKVRVVQNEQLLGYATYNGQPNTSNIVVLKTDDAPVFGTLQIGKYTLEVYEVKYLIDGAECVYSDESNPIGSVTYMRSVDDGTVVNEIQLKDDTFLSYYDPADDSDGVVVYTFSKPVLPDHLDAYLEFGEGTQYFIHGVPYTLSDDGLTLTIDLRGVNRGIDNYLAPGVTFVDVMGQPIAPPTDISLNVNGVNCADGSLISYYATSLDGEFGTVIRGSLFKSYNYIDLGFVTPAIMGVDFYNNATPEVKYAAINDDTDMMDIHMLNAEYIQSADLVLTVGDVVAKIADSKITKDGNTFTIALPRQIKEAGSDGMVISFENVTFTEDDGGQHVIKPYEISSAVPEVLTIAALKATEPNKKVVLNSVAGIKVTLANDMGYTFAEDETGGIMVITADFDRALEPSTLVQGRLVGTYLGYGTFMIDKKQSTYIENNIDVTFGQMITDMAQLESGRYDNCLVTIEATETLPIEVDIDANIVLVNGTVPVITDFIGEIDVPETVKNVTGVYYNDASVGQPVILLRYIADLNHYIDSIESILNGTSDSKVYDLRGVEVLGSSKGLNSLTPGVYIIGGKKVKI